MRKSAEMIQSRLNLLRKNTMLEKSLIVSRDEYYDWPRVIGVTCGGTLLSVSPLLAVGYWFDQNDYKKGIPPNKSKIKSSYLPALCLAICVGVGLNNVKKGQNKSKQYR